MSSEYEIESDRNVLGSVVAGAVIGVVIGGALALLFAPKAGMETRSDLSRAVDDLKDKAEQVLDGLQESSAELVTRTKTTLDQTRENLVRSVEAGKDAYVQKKEELTSQLEA